MKLRKKFPQPVRPSHAREFMVFLNAAKNVKNGEEPAMRSVRNLPTQDSQPSLAQPGRAAAGVITSASAADQRDR